MLDFDQFEVLTFDCYGTLIDWESGILAALEPFLIANQIQPKDSEILETYGKIEPKIQSQPYQNYKTVLQNVLLGFGQYFGFTVKQGEKNLLVDSLKNWPPFPDTAAMLKKLQNKFKLAIISNIDDDLFAHSNRHLQVRFDWIITAEQCRSYKPSLNNFQQALEIIGLPEEKILHVAQSIFHDIVPARQIGLATVWVNRRLGKRGSGATPPAQAQPDVKVPDLKSLVNMIF